MAEDLNSGLPSHNSASTQSGTWTQSLRIASPVLWPLSHAASYYQLIFTNKFCAQLHSSESDVSTHTLLGHIAKFSRQERK